MLAEWEAVTIMITYCASCGIANRGGDERCQTCDRRLRKPTAEELSAPRSNVSTSLSVPVYVQAERQRLARITCRSLLSAALMSITRAMLMPYLITQVPRGTFGRIDAAAIQQNGFYAAIAFGIAAIWAKRDPLLPTVAALSLYLGLAIPDAMDGSTLLSRGLISKTIMVLILLRALTAAIRYRMTRNRPALAAFHA